MGPQICGSPSRSVFQRWESQEPTPASKFPKLASVAGILKAEFPAVQQKLHAGESSQPEVFRLPPP